eukprot:m.195366 g.195366  ORF g.195366 m.195366 type:complete len:94 (-) comp53717_c0_seq14:1405-1686(-)
MAALGRALLQSDVSKFLQATRPLLVNGKWRKPQINARIVAKLRKEAFLSEQVAEISLEVVSFGPACSHPTCVLVACAGISDPIVATEGCSDQA